MPRRETLRQRVETFRVPPEVKGSGEYSPPPAEAGRDCEGTAVELIVSLSEVDI